MKKDIKEAWIKDLRSGNFKQIFHIAKENEISYCAIGLLAQITKDIREDGIHSWGQLSQNSGVPVQTLWEISFMNDAKDSFEKIASYIEEKL